MVAAVAVEVAASATPVMLLAIWLALVAASVMLRDMVVRSCQEPLFVLLVALAAGLPVPFSPVHIVLLEVFMDLGASVAFVAEPAAPDAMRRPPRPATAVFLDRPELQALVTVAGTLTLATLPAYLLLAATNTPAARAAAVLGWLAGHAVIAWTLRTQPGLSWRTSPAFPTWAITATGAGLLVAVTPAGRLIHLTPPDAGTLTIVAGTVVAAVLTAHTTSRLLHLRRRL